MLGVNKIPYLCSLGHFHEVEILELLFSFVKKSEYDRRVVRGSLKKLRGMVWYWVELR